MYVCVLSIGRVLFYQKHRAVASASPPYLVSLLAGSISVFRGLPGGTQLLS